MAVHKGLVETNAQSSRSRALRMISAGSAGLAISGSAVGARGFALQRTMGNRALGSPSSGSSTSGSAHKSGDFLGSLLQRVATMRPAASTPVVQRDPFFRVPPRISASAATGTVQRFKDAVGGEDVTEEMIEKASLEKLKEWLARPEYDFLSDEPENDTYPDTMDREKIQKRIDAIGQGEKDRAKAEKEREKQENLEKEKRALLLRLGVSATEYDEITKTSTNEPLITKVSAWCSKKEITVTSALDAIKGFDAERRLMALEIFGKGQVESVAHVSDLCRNWAALNERDTLDITLLVRLLNGGAVTAGGGTYRIPKLTGTMDMAIPFYSNGTVERRIDPEFHVHYTLKDGPSNPGFKRLSQKKKTGPGTRRVVTSRECDSILKASGAL